MDWIPAWKQLKGPRSICLAGRHIFESVRASFIPYAHVHAIARLSCGVLNFANVENNRETFGVSVTIHFACPMI